MAAENLNTVRSTIEERLQSEFRKGRPITTVFSNTHFDASAIDTFIQCSVSFSTNNYLTQGSTTSSTNFLSGLVLINVFTEEGIGSGKNFTICKRIRDLYNRVTVSNVIFDSPIGPEILQSSIEGKFQTQIRVTFEIFEDL
tara:strand:- start:7658 stop:8080 length:423 start_codon:yes stop_codon:yes gene_type:complete